MAKEIPILFSTPMVQAILEGRKTMTRRIVKFPKDFTGEVYNNAPYGLIYSSSLYGGTVQRLAYALPGDVLWVRESWSPKYVKGGLEGFKGYYPGVHPWIYKADMPNAKTGYAGYGWKPSIHMPKDACRIFLEVTSVRVERLQDITEADILSEGVSKRAIEEDSNPFTVWCELWQSINGEESWALNPWVWVVEFKRLEGRP